MKYRYIKEYNEHMVFMNIVEDRDGVLYLLKYYDLDGNHWTSNIDELYNPYSLATAVEEISEEDFFLEFI